MCAGAILTYPHGDGARQRVPAGKTDHRRALYERHLSVAFDHWAETLCEDGDFATPNGRAKYQEWVISAVEYKSEVWVRA